MAAGTRHPRVLITGASGYVGGRLLEALAKRDVATRCLVRRPDYFRGGPCELAVGNVSDRRSLRRAMAGIEVAYYLVRRLGSRRPPREQLLVGARNFAEAAAEAGVGKIIYLGRLPRRGGQLNLANTALEIGSVLSQAGVPTLEFRASAILGSGSLLYEVTRALVDGSPMMLVPRWAYRKFRPIAVEDVVSYLTAGLEHELGDRNEVVEIGGPELVSFSGLMKEYARQQKLRRFQLPLPISSIRLSSHWMALFTPVPAGTNQRLIEDLLQATPMLQGDVQRRFPVFPLGYRDAVARALVHEGYPHVETRWSDAVSSGSEPQEGPKAARRPHLSCTDETWVPYPPSVAFHPIQRIGGDNGWYCSNWLWRLRGLLDLLAGGVGLRRGRRDPVAVRTGDAIDFWRVQAFEPDRLLRLEAEMRVPGRAWLEFRVEPVDSGSVIRLTAFFDPRGLLGALYWQALYPLHVWIFRGMLRQMSDLMGSPGGGRSLPLSERVQSG